MPLTRLLIAQFVKSWKSYDFLVVIAFYDNVPCLELRHLRLAMNRSNLGLTVGVHVVSLPRLAGTAVPATVMRDAAVAMGREKKHLIFKSVHVQRPAVTENHGLT